MAKQERVPPTPAPEPTADFSGPISPVEIIFHAAGLNVDKFPTPGGTVTVLQLLSPTGIAVTVRLNDEDVDKVVSELKGISIVTLPGLVTG